jgi:short-subunit dehydrogenase
MRLDGSTVWITGASSGIGEALARELAARGATLVLSARRADELERVRASLPRAADHLVLPLDLERPEGFAEAVSKAWIHTGAVDALVNNAGVSQRGLAADTPMEVGRRIMEIGYFGPVGLTQALLPRLRARGSGRVMVVSSVMGYVGTPMRSSYAAAKHALHGWFDSLRAELWREGVGVTIACPGYVRSRVSENALTASGAPQGRSDRPSRRGISCERCARALARALERDRDEVHVGGTELAGIWLQRLLPALFRRIVRNMDFGQEAVGRKREKRVASSEE